MTKNEFNMICANAGIDCGIALESDAVVDALKHVASYPANMHADAVAYVEDVIAGEF